MVAPMAAMGVRAMAAMRPQATTERTPMVARERATAAMGDWSMEVRMGVMAVMEVAEGPCRSWTRATSAGRR
jgi:hypothetical protein